MATQLILNGSNQPYKIWYQFSNQNLINNIFIYVPTQLMPHGIFINHTKFYINFLFKINGYTLQI